MSIEEPVYAKRSRLCIDQLMKMRLIGMWPCSSSWRIIETSISWAFIMTLWTHSYVVDDEQLCKQLMNFSKSATPSKYTKQSCPQLKGEQTNLRSTVRKLDAFLSPPGSKLDRTGWDMREQKSYWRSVKNSCSGNWLIACSLWVGQLWSGALGSPRPDLGLFIYLQRGVTPMSTISVPVRRHSHLHFSCPSIFPCVYWQYLHLVWKCYCSSPLCIGGRRMKR